MNLATAAPPLQVGFPGIRVVPLANGSWRVTRADGALVGNVEPVADEAGSRYRARRFVARDAGFRLVGEFWTPVDAVDALRFG